MQTDSITASFIVRLVETVPELAAIRDEHIADYDEVLSFVFIADVTRFLIEAYRRSLSGEEDVPRHHGIVLTILRLFEVAFGADDLELQSLITVSFLENLWQADDLYGHLKLLLGPRLRVELAYLEG